MIGAEGERLPREEPGSQRGRRVRPEGAWAPGQGATSRLLPTVAAHRPASSRQASLCADPSCAEYLPLGIKLPKRGGTGTGPGLGGPTAGPGCVFQSILSLLRVGSPALARPVPSLGDMCFRQGPRQARRTNTRDGRRVPRCRHLINAPGLPTLKYALCEICERPLSVPLQITPCTDPPKPSAHPAVDGPPVQEGEMAPCLQRQGPGTSPGTYRSRYSSLLP